MWYRPPPLFVAIDQFDVIARADPADHGDGWGHVLRQAIAEVPPDAVGLV